MPLDYPNAVMVELVQSLHGRPLENILKFESSIPFDVGALAGLAGEVIGWWDANIAPVMSQDLTLEGVIVTSIDLSNPIMYVETGGLPVGGGQPFAALPVNVAMMTRLFTGFIGASRKGRVYNSGFAEQDATGNTWGSTPVGAIQTAYNELITILTLTDWTWVVASGMNEPGPGTGVTSPVLSCYTDNQVRDMGRRLNNT